MASKFESYMAAQELKVATSSEESPRGGEYLLLCLLRAHTHAVFPFRIHPDSFDDEVLLAFPSSAALGGSFDP